ncbi:hypothetical protein PPYR_08017 [Photinus pyralis]|uniref:MARVEL domain-containing protein n=1 Tax=Photinus pyralis TaxID=7054 RepID=A0A5N4AS28_PHOPY|nr:lysosomal-associated transmembrane protein 4B-like [Photinus pyralis]XP_031339445.1 lysosomal-associated transmembrane protein 4B-like [Photinus pyralis]KAB0800137.1 hypothetical protein PPYR_08017 [Photinus pyralis]
MQLLNSCCGCCDLRTGTIIVGICGFLFTIAGIITQAVFLESIEEEDTKSHVRIIVVYSYLYVVVNIMLLYGSVKVNKHFLLPWIVYVAFGLGLCTLFCLIFMFFAPELFAGTLMSGLLWYAWYAVVSFYIDMNKPTTTIVTIGGYSGIPQNSYVAASSVVSYDSQPPCYANYNAELV